MHLFFDKASQGFRADSQDSARLVQITLGVAQNLAYVAISYFLQSLHSYIEPFCQ